MQADKNISIFILSQNKGLLEKSFQQVCENCTLRVQWNLVWEKKFLNEFVIAHTFFPIWAKNFGTFFKTVPFLFKRTFWGSNELWTCSLRIGKTLRKSAYCENGFTFLIHYGGKYLRAKYLKRNNWSYCESNPSFRSDWTQVVYCHCQWPLNYRGR